MNSTAEDPTAAENAQVITAVSRLERLTVLGVIAVVVVLTTLPYLLAFSVSSNFVGQIYNIVDYSVYLSWTRQAADGHFATLNLFTTLKQHGYLFNALFLVLGNIVRFTHLPIPIAFMIVRIIGAVVLLRLAYKLCSLAFPKSSQARLTSFALIALSSGFGWKYWPAWSDKNAGSFPVDVWQPEAFTFLSIYTSVLFVIATIFILTAVYNLVRGEQTGKLKYSCYAGICGLVLGNIHSYDVLHLAAAWGFYLVAISIVEKRFDRDRWLRAVVAGVFTLPTTVYQYWVFKHETVFRLRALTPTLSPPLFYYAMGYGLVFFLALGAIALIVVRRAKFSRLFGDTKILTWVLSWAVAGLTIIYLPVEFQRKMVMGEQIPLCILAGGAASLLVQGLSTQFQRICLTVLVLLTLPSNALFLLRDIHHIEENKSEIADANPFLTDAQIGVLNWIKLNTRPGDAILALPPIGQFVPGYCDRAVWVGHWSETPNYGQKLAKLTRMLSARTPEASRYGFLKSTETQYLVYPIDAAESPIVTGRHSFFLADLAENPPSYLTAVHRVPDNRRVERLGGYVIFKID
jgi:hypothetical protein